jgi:DNA-binding NarL/FixJ family response regulator
MSGQAAAKLRVFLADDHPVVLAGIKSVLSEDQRLEIIGEARDGQTALRMAMELKPNIIVLDLSTSNLNGMDVTRQLRAHVPTARWWR